MELDEVELAQLAIEVWRLGHRVGAPELSRDRLDDSMRRLIEALEVLGVRILDPTGDEYTAETDAEVIAFYEPADSAPHMDAMTITQVLRPSVYVENARVVSPQIVVGHP